MTQFEDLKLESLLSELAQGSCPDDEQALALSDFADTRRLADIDVR